MTFLKSGVRKTMFRVAALATVGLGLSGCVYDVGLGYASDGYYGDSNYGCDPYGGFDSYYDCDNGYGFGNIGYGGGWYDNFYYPGYGFVLFDNYGRRFQMRDHYRRYWGERRHRWYRENRGRHDDYNHNGGHYRDGRGYRGDDRMRDGDRNQRPRGDVQRRRNRGDLQGDINATPPPAAMPEPNAMPEPGRGEGRRGGGRRWDNEQPGAVRAPRTKGDGAQGRRYRQPPPETTEQSVAQVPEQTPQIDNPRQERAPRENDGRSYQQPD